MPEMRQDITTGIWSIIATERAKRPEMPEIKKNKPALPAHNENCFFCSGNEQTTPPEVYSIRPQGRKANTAGWLIRVVENKFAALNLNNHFLTADYQGLYPVSHACGVAEVVIETPDHSRQISSQTIEEIERTLTTFKDRVLTLYNTPDIKYVQVFKNCGAMAGASLEHPHAQIIAVPVIPDYIQHELNMATDYYKRNNRCVYCDMIELELNDRQRIIYENDSFLAIVPYAAKTPYEMKILPKFHEANYENINIKQLKELAITLRSTIYRLDFALDNPPYNWYIHTAPVRTEKETCYHWHIEITPKLSIQAGFELSTGMYINVTVPEDCAAFLKNIDDTL